MSFRRVVVCALAYAAGGAAARAQTPDSLASRGSYWRHFGYGVATSLALHEMAHVMTAEAVGGHPWFGFDKLRPTIYSGINSQLEPHKQFLFSAAGLTIQSLVDEAILDIPHARGSAFERGVLGGGIGTTLFYLTIGRRGSVSDVDFMARTHAMTITQVTLLFGSVAALHTFRISRDRHYANFFARPAPNGRVELGVQLGKP
ncbi:MAG TPA: hypothetical protein VL524_08120 [Gemmatimonadaceae bacterium]|nr:hypothetical protein [Gemmatimonadaceae bacterium]